MGEVKLKLIKFGADFCGPCRAMDRAQTLEKFVGKHSNVILEKHTIADREGRQDYGDYKKASKLSDKYEVTALPTIIFEDDKGKELARMESGLSARELEALYQQAQRRLEVRLGITDEDEDEDEEDETEANEEDDEDDE